MGSQVATTHKRGLCSGDYIAAFGSADTSGYEGIFFFEYVRVPDYTA
jgi:hypothetical protein